MHTITFYSYKGGVGRSLLVANAAKYLSTLGKKVFVLDLDLEAPGIQYKFELGPGAARSPANVGVVDILIDFVRTREMPVSLAQYATPLKVSSEAGSIHIMRAGTAPHGDYWRRLSQVNWYELFYGPMPIGVPFFLELKEQIRSEYNPDFFLIDARTGITEMGGVATTLLPDTVVCISLDSPEHLEGLRAVMQGIKQTTTREGRPVNLVAVISRLPAGNEQDSEIANVLSFLNEKSDAGVSLGLDEVVVLHAEPLLEAGEQLLVGGKSGPHELPLLRDYLRLFSKIIPAADIQPHVGLLIRHALSRLLDEPDAAQSELETLTTYCADQEAYRALLKLYMLRNAPTEKIVATASTMWHLAGSGPPDQILIDIVKLGFGDSRLPELQKKYADFAESIWRATDMKDIRIGLNVATAYLPERRDRAVDLLMDYLDKVEKPSSTAIVRLIDISRAGSLKLALSVVDRFKGSVQPPDFYAAWARVIVTLGDAAIAQQVFKDKSFDVGSVRAADPLTMYRLFKLAGEPVPDGFLQEAIDRAADAEEYGAVVSFGEIFLEEGRLDEFQALLAGRKRLPQHIAEDILERVRVRRGRGPRYMARPMRYYS